MTFEIRLSEETVKVKPVIKLYTVKDYMGKDMPGLAIQLYSVDFQDENVITEPFAMLTTCFGEFIGMKNTAYIDTNNCPFAVQVLETGVATDTGFTKRSGFCSYPLWEFKEDFLTNHGKENYAYYSRKFDEYMAG